MNYMTGSIKHDERSSSSRKRVASVLMIAVISLAVFLTPFTSTASASSPEVPVKGVMENTETVIGFAFPNLTVAIDGELTATHFGDGTVSGVATIDISAFAPGGCTELVAGTIAFTAADGSVLDMIMTANQACMDVSGVITGGGQYKVVGGTGRFGGATGTIDFDIESLSPGQSVSTLSGSISK